jgi:hypothetical protein
MDKCELSRGSRFEFRTDLPLVSFFATFTDATDTSCVVPAATDAIPFAQACAYEVTVLKTFC